MLSKSEEKLLHGLKQRRVRERQGLFLAEGVRVVEDLLSVGIDLRLAVVSSSLEDSDRGRALAAALAARCPLQRVSDAALDRLAATETPQGVVVAARAPETRLGDVDLDGRATLLVLDAVQDPGNFGTMVRSADAFGARAVVALAGSVDPWNPKAVRAAAGSAFRVPIVSASARELETWARENQVALYVAAAEGRSIEGFGRAIRAGLVVGNEGAGVSAALRAIAHETLAVPTTGAAESLNVATAAGILLYLLTRPVA